MSKARDWLCDSADPRPVELGRWLDQIEGADGTAAELLTECARAALDTALGRPGRHRPTAFDLLAAGAFLGYACEAALADEEACRTLWMIVGRMSG